MEKTGEPAIEWLKNNTDKAMVDELLNAAKTGEQAKAVGTTTQAKASSSNNTIFIIIGAVVVLVALFAIFGKKKTAAQ